MSTLSKAGSLNMRRTGLLTVCTFLAACASNPYVIHTSVNESRNERTELVCTHKTMLIPYYAIFVAGFFTFRYGQECHDEVSPLSQPSKYAEQTTVKVDPSKGVEQNPCPSGQVSNSKAVCESPTPIEPKVPISEPSSEQNRVVPGQQ